ncbi:hypothetical protein Tco_1448717 [Tanacetum coccineum]
MFHCCRTSIVMGMGSELSLSDACCLEERGTEEGHFQQTSLVVEVRASTRVRFRLSTTRSVQAFRSGKFDVLDFFFDIGMEVSCSEFRALSVEQSDYQLVTSFPEDLHKTVDFLKATSKSASSEF